MPEDLSPDKTAVIDRYGVIGYPVSHSRSPFIHRLFAQQTGQQIQYEALQVAPDKLETAIKRCQHAGWKGINVTVPHKSEIIRLVENISDRAASAGAVNTLTFRNGETHGDNTDGVGLVRDLVENLDVSVAGANILILGAGGATRGIVGPLLEQHPAAIRIANRTLGKAQGLADHFSDSVPVTSCRFEAIPEDDPYDIVINATSAGLKGETPPFPASAISPETFCYDLSYAVKPTPFSVWARKAGAKQSVMGWGMLVEQGAESFRIWRGVRPDTAPILKQMKIKV